jgi:hypothetical protein
MPDELGTIYVLTNAVMPGLVKIGITNGTVEDRVKELSGASGIPVAFECHFAAKVTNYAGKEQMLFQIFSEQRVNPKREFFRVAPEKVVLAIRMGEFTDVTPGKVSTGEVEEDQAHDKAVQSSIKRRSAIRLEAIGIMPGTVLTFSRDPNIHATVVLGNKVNYEGQVISLSAAAVAALHKQGSTTPAASGSDYWTIDNETLDEIRIKREAELESQDDD